MKLSALSAREQVLVVVTAAVMIGGAYGLLRYWPAVKALRETAAQTKATEERLQKLVIPDEPVEDMARLQRDLDAARMMLQSTRQRMAGLEQRLAPPGSQELKLKISELAQFHGVRIRENEAYKPPVPQPTTPAQSATGAMSATPATNAGQGGPTSATVGSGGAQANGPPLEMLELFLKPEWKRPLQRISMEGSYAGLRGFITALDKLPWQVSVVQLGIEVDERTPPFGLPQPLRATMILAL